MTIREMRDELAAVLTEVVDPSEARAMANIIIEDIKGYTATEMVMHSGRELLPETVERMREIARKVVEGLPLQYAIGTARFRGRDFKVTPQVLIPRPETGQLVDMIVDDYGSRSDLRVLDLGTGTGCIAVSLALDLPFAQVDAIDVSVAAVDIAKENAQKLRAKVNAMSGNIFSLENTPVADRTYDIIVSNPPYILMSEAPGIDPRVRDHEPSRALFVPDSDPIGIYVAIARYAKEHLDAGGRLYLEINPLCAKALSDMLSGYFHDVRIEADYKGNLRFCICKR